MEDMKKVLGFDWNKEAEWEKYLSELQEFYDYLTQLVEAREILSDYAGSTLWKTVTKDNTLERIFVGGMGSEQGYQKFMWDVYGIGIDEYDFERAKENPEEAKTPEERKKKVYEKVKIRRRESTWPVYHSKYDENWKKGTFPAVVQELKSLFEAAGFRSDAKFEGDYKEVVENILKKYVKLSPLTNPKTFFINSLRYTPKFYIERMYGDTDFLQNYFYWQKFSNWNDVAEDYNLWSFESGSKWDSISKLLDEYIYGPINYYSPNFAPHHNDVWHGEIFQQYTSNYLHTNEIVKEYYKQYLKKLKYPHMWNKIIAELDYWWYIIQLNEKFDIFKFSTRSGTPYVQRLDSIKQSVGKDVFIKYLAPQLFVKTSSIYSMKATTYNGATGTETYDFLLMVRW